MEKGGFFLPRGKFFCDSKPAILELCPTETPADSSGILN